MSKSITIKVEKEITFTTLAVRAGVRYWDDATVNGIEDGDGELIPLRSGDCWCPRICVDTGKITTWPIGTTASIHYKVCDCGVYTLIDDEGNEVLTIDGYVPRCMAPKGGGYGDYIIMDVDENGMIDGWKWNDDGFVDDDN